MSSFDKQRSDALDCNSDVFIVLPTVDISLSTVPRYLHTSPLFLAFDHSDPEGIAIPSDCFRTDLLLNCASDVESLLRTLRFWLVSILPDELLAFLSNTYSSEIKRVLKNYDYEFRLHRLYYDLHHHVKPSMKIKTAAYHNRLDFVQFYERQGSVVEILGFTAACKAGHVNLMEYMYPKLSERERSMTTRPLYLTKILQLNAHIDGIMFLTQQFGSEPPLHLCKLAVEMDHFEWMQKLLVLSHRSWKEFALQAAVQCSIQCLRAAVEAGCEIDHGTINLMLLSKAAECKREQCFAYLMSLFTPQQRENFHFFYTLVLSEDKQRNLFTLKLLHAHGGSVKAHMATTLVAFADIDSLDYVQSIVGNLHTDTNIMFQAVAHRHLSLVQALHQRGYTFTWLAIYEAMRLEEQAIFEYLYRLKSRALKRFFSVFDAAPPPWCVQVMQRVNKEILATKKANHKPSVWHSTEKEIAAMQKHVQRIRKGK